ncbi:MAG: MPN551 family DNA-binding protein [Mycoplasma sp.]
MPFTKKQGIDFNLQGNRVILTESFMASNSSKFKKITGSRFASVIGKSEYNSPFKAWCIMVGIFADTMDPTLAKVGNTIEPKIHEYVCKKTGINFKQYNPFEIKWDVFKGDDVFGGIPDGEPIDTNGNLLYPSQPMLEIKTTSTDAFLYKFINNSLTMQKDLLGNPIIKKVGEKRAKWFDAEGDIKISDEYKYQLGLYCYLRRITKGLFAICFLESSDYSKPEECNVNEREIKLVEFEINTDDFEEIINYAREWHKKYILTGQSPELTTKDLEWINNELK